MNHIAQHVARHPHTHQQRRAMAMTHLGMQADAMKLPNQFLELLHGLGQLYIIVSRQLDMRGRDGQQINRPTLSNT